MTTGTRQFTLRPPPSSPSLAALLEMEPPSPILSPSDLSPFRTSGEIPILLFDSPHATAASPKERDQSLFSTPISNPRTCELNSKPNLRAVDLELDGFSISPTGIGLEQMVIPNLTFGIAGCKILESKESRLSLRWSSSLSTKDFKRDGLNAADQQSPNTTEHGIEHYHDSWLGARSWRPSDAENSPSLRLEHGLYSDAEQTLPIQDSRFADAPLVDSDLIMCASPSTPTSNLNHHKRGQSTPTTRERLTSGFGSAETTLIDPFVGEASSTQGILALSSVSPLSREPLMHAACSPSTPRREFDTLTSKLSVSQSQIITGNQDAGRILRDSTNSGSPESNVPSLSEKHSLSLSSYVGHYLGSPLPRTPPSQSTKTTASLESSPHYNHPWLQNATIGLVIDQEGFRSIEPTFKIVEIRRVYLESGNKELDVAMFVPTTKRVYRFHYAPFEGMPILRRLIINGDESRDFLSRQAYLGLKSDGVYIVHGTEVASPTAVSSPPSLVSVENALEMVHTSGRTQGQHKLYWSFEYSIEDRKADQPGRSLDGERVLIPLRFSCSPQLIHPSQGKKVKLMHIVRKSVTPKLVAERKQQSFHHSETRVTALPPLRTRFTPRTGLEYRLTPQSPATSQAWNSHKRSHSTDPREDRLLDVWAKTSQANDFRGQPSDSFEIDLDSKSTHRRRASSAEASPRLRHIIPPSRLRQLLEEGRNDHNTQVNASYNKAISSPPLDFFPLKPSPRFRVHQ